jgi:hypothetical protein
MNNVEPTFLSLASDPLFRRVAGVVAITVVGTAAGFVIQNGRKDIPRPLLDRIDQTKLGFFSLLSNDALAVVASYLDSRQTEKMIFTFPIWKSILSHIEVKRSRISRSFPPEIIKAIGLETLLALPLIRVPGEIIDPGVSLDSPSWERAHEGQIRTPTTQPDTKKLGYSRDLSWSVKKNQEHAALATEWPWDIPPACWPLIRGPEEKEPCGLLHYLTSSHLQNHPMALIVDPAGRSGIAFQYTCTCKIAKSDRLKTFAGVAVLHQAHPDHTAPWVWVDNIPLSVSSAVGYRGVIETTREKRWFLFYHTQRGCPGPDCETHCHWLARFTRGERCGWLLEGDERISDDDIESVQLLRASQPSFLTNLFFSYITTNYIRGR